MVAKRPRRKDPPPMGRELQNLFDRLPPHNQEAEMALLGSMLLSGAGDVGIIGDVIETLRGAGDFYLPRHQAIYQAIIDIWNKNNSIDGTQLSAKLKDRGIYDEVGGFKYLLELAEGVSVAINGPRFAKIVRDKAVLRDMVNVCGEGLRDCYEDSDDAEGVIDKFETAVFEVTDKGESEANRATSMGSIIQEQFELMEKIKGGTFPGLKTGFMKLDELLLGFHKGEMITLASRPSMGKTALALNIAEHIAVDSNKAVGVMSMEMSKQELGLRAMSSRSRVDSNKLRQNQLQPQQLRDIQRAAKELSESKLYIDDSPGLSIARLRAKARRMAARHDIKLLIVDYLQLMHSSGYEKRHEEVSAMSRGIKALARELNIPILCLSQLNRMSTTRDDKRPRMSELRESGSIEQDSDVVMLLHREAHFNVANKQWAIDNPEKLNIAELIIEKQRNGRTGVIELNWFGECTRFENAAGGHVQAAVPANIYPPARPPTPHQLKLTETQPWNPSDRD